MQKARLFCTTWGSPRRAILSLFLIGVFAAPLVFGLSATPAFAEDPLPAPGPVTDVSIDAVGTTKATVSWTPPAPGECPVTHYFIVYFTPSHFWTITIPIQKIQVKDAGRATLTLSKLKENTEYRWAIRTTSTNCASNPSGRVPRWLSSTWGAYWGAFSTPAYVTFKTKSPESPAPVESKKPPLKPRKLKFSSSDDSVTISWKAPKKRSSRCAHSSYSMQTEDYTVPRVRSVGFFVEKQYGISGTSAKVSGLTSGHRYEVYVVSYSAECDQYSPVLRKIYTHK